jgi:hypothetical protein
MKIEHVRQKANRAEREHGPEITQPGHLLVRVGAGEFVNQALDGREEGKPGSLAGIHLVHETAQRRRQRDSQAKEEQDLNDFN